MRDCSVRFFEAPSSRWRAVGCLLALSFFAACGTTPAITVIRPEESSKYANIRGDVVKLKRGTQETFSGANGGFYVVRSGEDWEAAWPRDRTPPMPPTLDTGAQMLLLAVSASKDVTNMKIVRALENAEAVYVFVRETKLGHGCVNKSNERAFDAVVALRADKPVKFILDEEHGDSCGDPPVAGVMCRLKTDQAWAKAMTAQPGDVVECELTATARGKFELVDRILSMADLPAGSSSKLAFAKGPTRGEFGVDVYGTYTINAEAVDEAGRRGKASATIDVKPPKTKDVLVQLVWAGFDVKDESDTFPRVNLRVAEEGPKGQRCSAEIPIPGLCEVKSRGAYTYMRIPAGNRHLPISVQFIDERVEKGPGPCVHVWFDGARTVETCDRRHRDADEIWKVGTVDTTTGKLDGVEDSPTTKPEAPKKPETPARPETPKKPEAPKKPSSKKLGFGEYPRSRG